MAVQIVLNQAGKAAGVAGVAREDLALATNVVASVTGGPFLAYQWGLIDKPVDVLLGVQSASYLASPIAASTAITPIDIAGTWLLSVLVDSGSGLGAGPDDRAEISFYAGPTLASAAADLPRRDPGFREQLHHNVADAIFPSGNTRGWAQEWSRWFAFMRNLYASRIFASGRIYLTGGGATVVSGTNIFSATRTAQGTVGIVFTKAAANANYIVTPAARGTPGGQLTVDTETINGFMAYRGDAAGQLVDADFNFIVQVGN